MKNLLLCLIALTLIGTMPIKEWKKVPQEQLLQTLWFQMYGKTECAKQRVVAKETKKEVKFFWECLDPPEKTDIRM